MLSIQKSQNFLHTNIFYTKSYSSFYYRIKNSNQLKNNNSSKFHHSKFNSMEQKRFFSNSSMYEKTLRYISVILEDDKRFSVYFRNNFPKSFKYLPIIKLITIFFIFMILILDYSAYSTFFSVTIQNESVACISPKFYSQYLFCFYFGIILYEFFLSSYVTLKANSPV